MTQSNLALKPEDKDFFIKWNWKGIKNRLIKQGRVVRVNNFKNRLYKNIIVSLFSLSAAVSVCANPMHDVAVTGNIEVARYLVKIRDKISLDINATREDGCTPLHVR